MPTNNFKLGPLPVGMAARLVNSGTSVDLRVTAAGQSLTWYGADGLGQLIDQLEYQQQQQIEYGAWKYLQYSGNSYGDNVTFDDGFILVYTSINLGVRWFPSIGDVQQLGFKLYSITGTGGIDGVVAVVVTNTGSVFGHEQQLYRAHLHWRRHSSITKRLRTRDQTTGSVALLGWAPCSSMPAPPTPGRSPSPPTGMAYSGATVQFNGSITGNAFLTKTGDGILNLTTPNAVSVLGPGFGRRDLLSDANAAMNSNIGPNVDNGVTFNSGIGNL